MGFEPPKWFGQARGFAIIAMIMFSTLVGLLIGGKLQGGDFNFAFGALLTAFFGGGALASFRK